jgi:hypothetical protein
MTADNDRDERFSAWDEMAAQDPEFARWVNEATARPAAPKRSKPRSNYVSQKQLDKMLVVIGRWCGQQIGEALRDAVRPLQARLAELEATKFEYLGVWREGLQARPNQTAMRGGSLWICVKETDRAPGEPDSGWKLATKRGRDARERKDTSK